jgi:serine/threonine-protein kinase PknG
LQAGRAAAAADVLTELETALAREGQPADWRIDWYRGMVALSDGAAEDAVPLLHKVYAALPGELAPKLALGQANELAGDHEAASRWYGVVATTDAGYPSAAFGLARCRAALGDHDGELAAYRHVPETSSAHVDAQIAEVAAMVGSGEGPLDLGMLQRAGEIVEGLPTGRQERARLAARVLEACLLVLQRNGSLLDPCASVMHTPFEERAVRLELEATYRSLAKNATSSAQRTALVDRANQVRPRSWR